MLFLSDIGKLGTGFLVSVALFYGMKARRSSKPEHRRQFLMLLAILFFELLSIVLPQTAFLGQLPAWLQAHLWPFWVLSFILYPASGLVRQVEQSRTARERPGSMGAPWALGAALLITLLFALPMAAGVVMVASFLALAVLALRVYRGGDFSRLPASASLGFILIAVGTTLGVVSGYLRTDAALVLYVAGVATAQLASILVAVLMTVLNERNQSQTERDVVRVQNELVYRMTHDSLTGLLNRSSLIACLEEDAIRPVRQRCFSHALYIDVDHFHQICDGLGPHRADLFLQQVARCIVRTVADSCQVFHMGEDKFMVLQPSDQGEDMAEKQARSLLKAFSIPVTVGDSQSYLTVSIGIDSLCHADGSGKSCEEVMRNLDQALDVAKLDHNAYRVFVPGMMERGTSRIQMANLLSRAVEREEFCLHFQPQVDCRGQVVGAEALLRWTNPVLGNVPPAEFISVAEETGLIIPIGEWVLEHACIEVAHWRDLGIDIPLAVNVSPRQLRDPHFEWTLQDQVKAHGLTPAALHIEITESIVLEENSEVWDRLWNLSRKGFHIAIDDFGTGYANLSYLKRLPVSALKIDRSFVTGIPGSAQDLAVVQAICAMARNLGLRTIAEGVDHVGQMAVLRDLECSAIQGYLYSRPVPSSEFISFCRDCA